MNWKAIAAAAGLILACGRIADAADLTAPYSEPAVGKVGIWGAIAYSEADGRHGFFWGADKREEAEKTALAHCENAGGKSCALVSTFRNHRHWDDDDGSGFPYDHCAALAVSAGAATPWAAVSAARRKEAEDLALKQCETGSAQCEIRERSCT